MQPSGVHDSFKRLLESAREATAHLPTGRRVLTESDLRRELAVSPQVSNNWKRRGVSVDGALAAQRRFGMSATWIADGKSPKTVVHWMSEQHPSGGAPILRLAQDLSHPTADDEPIHMQWESVVSAVTLPPRFRLAMPDDALAPATPRGTVLIFSTTATPAFGHGVLVQGADGERHVRRYAQGPGGRWLAEARNSAYLTLDSAAGARVLAVVVGRETGEV